jgi:dethiobiotin synthetase
VTHRKLTTLFFAGTDTNVGKTYTASLVASQMKQAGRRVGVYKPVASGCRRVDASLIADDAVALWEAAGCPRSLEEVCPQRFIEPLAPPEAAAAEGKVVDADLLRSGAVCWEADSDLLIIEGAGGLLSPLADGVLNIDLVKQFQTVTLLIVAANRLGAIHQALAACTAAIYHGVKPGGIILCDPTGDADKSAPSNAVQIERYCDVPVLGSIPLDGNLDHVAPFQKLLN